MTARNVRSRIGAAAATVVMTAGAVVAGAGVADAADIWIRTARVVTDDYAEAHVWSAGFTRDSASWMSGIWDRCGADGKGDGHGAYLRGRVRFGDGTWSAWTGWEGDSSGCADAGTTVSGGRTHPGRVVTDLQLQLCEIDGGNPGECVARVIDNPRVAG